MAMRRAPTTATTEAPAADAAPRPRLFTVDEYYKMAEAGILRPDERVQLIEGTVVEMPPIGPRHAYNVGRLAKLLDGRLGERVEVRTQNPLRLAVGAEPEPDLAVVSADPANPRRYESRHPGPSESLLVIEVADSTVAFDLGEKAAMYARHSVAELWVVDLPGDRLVVHREPTPDGYVRVTVLERGATLRALAFPDVTFTADEILG